MSEDHQQVNSQDECALVLNSSKDTDQSVKPVKTHSAVSEYKTRLGKILGRLKKRLAKLPKIPTPNYNFEVTPAIPPVRSEPNQNRLLQKSPLAIGFYGAIGVLLALMLANVIDEVKSVLLLVLLSLFIALGLNPIVESMTKRHIPRSIAVTIVALGFLGVLTLGIVSIIPVLSDQVALLNKNIPSALDSLKNNKNIADLDSEYHLIENLTSFLTSKDLLNYLFGGIWGASLVVVTTVFSLVVTLVLTIYFLASLPSIKNLIYSLSPASKRERYRYLVDQIFSGVGNYLTGMFIVVSIASFCAFIFMKFIGLENYALALTFIFAIMCFIPLVGETTAGLLISLVGLGVSPTVSLSCLIYFLVYQQFDTYVIYPNIMKRTVKVPSVIVILSALIGGMTLGIIGALIAIPTAAACILLYREVFVPYVDAK